MASETVKQEAERAKDCCNRILNAQSSEEIQQQVNELRSCCDNMEKIFSQRKERLSTK